MASLRFLSSLFALIAIVALVADMTPMLMGTGAFQAHSVINYWSELAPASMIATRDSINAMTFPWVWNPALLSILSTPMSLLFGSLAIVCGYFGRRRAQMKLHIN